MKLSPKQEQVMDYIRQEGEVTNKALAEKFGPWYKTTVDALYMRGLIKIRSVAKNLYLITTQGKTNGRK